MCGDDPAKYGCSDYKLMEEAGVFKISMGEFILTSGQGNPDERGIKKEEFIWVKL